MDIKVLLEQLICYALKNRLIETEDINYSRNLLLDLLNLVSPAEIVYPECSEPIDKILSPLLDYAALMKLTPSESETSRDLFAARIMGLLTPKPSQIINQFLFTTNHLGIENATHWFYEFSKKTNYIQCGKIAKNESWHSQTNYGELEITINLSKPEKDPKDIAEALNQKTSSYPKCVLCAENEGYAGNALQAPRQNHRLIPLWLNNEKWFFQYSPYLYYNEHCIVLSETHRPMQINKSTFERLLEFITKFPHYFIGSNADLPIVGGSILSHDHFQGGRHKFAMANASFLHKFHSNDFPNTVIGILKWPMSVIRLQSENKEEIVELANQILLAWKVYQNPELDILSHSAKTEHNSITPIARRKKKLYELDLVLRNNRTNEEFPDGIFHPHKNLHAIKKENIGLIEVMGLAILPGRLKTELSKIIENFNQDIDYSIHQDLLKHKEWILELKSKYTSPITAEELKQEVAVKFIEVLENSGVFKQNKEGLNAFYSFIEKIGFIAS
jgi:UDPglucose--hexose-1-phosphate uridylyltransferase